MIKLNWIESGDDFILPVGMGRAVIKPLRDHNNRTVFEVRVEIDNGTVLHKWVDTFRKLEDAQSYATYALQALDIPDPDDPQAKPDPARLEETLDYCTGLLHASGRESHRVRLQLIRQWLRSRHDQHRESSSMSTINWDRYHLDWRYDGHQSTAQTPYGLITVQATDLRYLYIRLTDPSGVDYDNSEFGGNFRSFDDAEARARDLLAEVDDPTVDEAHFCNIEFTLSICKALLPADADPMHLVRLDYLHGDLTGFML